jgi:hypothetical protein
MLAPAFAFEVLVMNRPTAIRAEHEPPLYRNFMIGRVRTAADQAAKAQCRLGMAKEKFLEKLGGQRY